MNSGLGFQQERQLPPSRDTGDQNVMCQVSQAGINGGFREVQGFQVRDGCQEPPPVPLMGPGLSLDPN